MQIISALIAGLIFGIGLIISGMSNPSKVLNFLDLYGNFDPSLIFVLAGAVITSYCGYRWLGTRQRPLFADQFAKAPSPDADGRLIFGAMVFGIGWGLVGLCPGPALTSLSIGGISAILFVAAMLIGMAVAKIFVR